MDDVDRRVLEIEGRFYRHGGAKVAAIRAELDLSPTIYAMRLNRLLEDPEAERVAPMLVHRLRRLRASRRRQRTSQRAS